ncbi:MAG: glycoside hydrolase family 95 protein [Candidatus Solibacter sp.]|jgi:alpha-L-fucosidase 2
MRAFPWLLFAFALMPHAASAADVAPGNFWWYRKPAAKYWEGSPLSNGRLAAMVLGRVRDETIPINDESLWSGSPYDPNNPEGPKILLQVRSLLLEGKFVEAQQLCRELMSRPLSVQHYRPMGELRLRFDGPDSPASYRRELDMDSAIARVTYQVGDTHYTREVFTSYPDQVLAMRITADKPGHISLAARLASIQPSARSTKDNGGEIVMAGTVESVTEGRSANPVIPSRMRWQARLSVLPEGGTAGNCRIAEDESRTSACISVKNANAVTIILAAATNFVSWNDLSADPETRAVGRMAAARIPYAGLRARHLKDWQPRFLACKLDLGGHEAAAEDTTARIEKLRKGGADPLFEAQYFQYGRYLLLAVSRPGTLAFNNHNVWLDNMEDRWNGRWTLNINLEECYWPAENTNLAETNEPLLAFVESLAQAGARTARELYGYRGWVAHLGTDIWMNTAPTDGTGPGIWPTAGAWLLQNLWEHYAFEPNTGSLKRLYPLLRGSSEFFLDFLMEEPAHHWLVTAPSVSPENSFYTPLHQKTQVGIGPTLDNQLLRDLFDHTVEAATTLGIDAELRAKIAEARKRLPPTRIGKHGQVQEWLEDYDEPEVTHRHLSQLYGFYPSDQITQAKTPELVKAVRTTLERRGEENRGWSGAWKICVRARLGEGDRAEALLRRMLTDISIHPREEDSNEVPSFEGNQGIQGVTAGIAEMLLQSQGEEIRLLPGLPKTWPVGKVEGLRARGGFVIDMVWQNGLLASVKLRSTQGRICRLNYAGKTITIQTEASRDYVRNGNLE